jgi:Na+/phosphate symporter
LGFLHSAYATPHTAVLAISVVSAAIGGFGVLSVTNLLAITFLSNIGTFILYGMTNLVALVAFLRHPQRNAFTHIVVPILGAIANMAMLVTVIYLGVVGGGDTKTAALMSIIGAAMWLVIGIGYVIVQSAQSGRRIIGEPVIPK